MTFTESGTVEQMILDTFTKRKGEVLPAHWDYVPVAGLPRRFDDVTVETWRREPLIRLDPKIAVWPDRADREELFPFC
jgi:hypothetical protein